MKLPQSLLLIILFLGLSLSGYSQFKTTIPLDKNVTSGVLANGMHYYILHNEWPQKRVSFYFVQNVGAILENKKQNGLAHFLEHMSFNGTKNFPGKGISNMLERYGVRFGADINAYTSTDQTVYNLSDVPTDNNLVIDSCLLVLHDWSGYLSLKNSEIDAERGVIREEWRTRRNVNFRLQHQINPAIYNHSKYVTHDVIGSLDVINNFKYKELKDYYHKWYLPSHQAVVVVGDIAPSEIEQKIKQIMGSIPMPKNAAKRYYVKIPDNKKLLYALGTDKEAQQTRINLFIKHPAPLEKDKKYLKQSFINSITFSMLNARYKELLENPQNPALSIGAGYSNLVRMNNVFYLIVSPKKGETIEAFKEAFTEIERARQYGFTQAELDRIKSDWKAIYKNYLENSNKVSNNSWAQQLADYFLTASPFQNPTVEYKQAMEFLNQIQLKDVNQVLLNLFTEKNRVLTVTGPKKEGISYPSKDDFESVIQSVEEQKLAPYNEKSENSPLITDTLTTSKVSKTFKIKGLKQAQGYILKNGAKVVLYPTDLVKNQILYYAYSKGGSSLLPSEDLPSEEIAVDYIENSGLGNFSNTDLQKKLSGKNIAITPFIDTYYEGISGTSSKEDIKSLLALNYLYFQHPRFDKNAFEKIINQYQNSLDNIESSDRKALSDTISLLNTNYSKRTHLFNKNYIKELNAKKAEDLFKTRIKNSADFTYVFVGSFKTDSLLPEIEKYIGSIPGDSTSLEDYRPLNISPSPGLSKRIFERDMNVPKTTVYIHLTDTTLYSFSNKIKLYIIGQLLSKQYLNTIREEEGGSYGVNVQTSMSELPKSKFSVTISFDCNPDKREKLLQIVNDKLNEIQDSLSNEKDFNDIKMSLIKSRQEQIKTNNYWMLAIVNSLKKEKAILSDEEFNATLKKITLDSIQVYAKKILSTPKRVEVIMNPSNKK